MIRLLRSAGLSAADGIREPPDHLSLMLNFMAELIERRDAGRRRRSTPPIFSATAW